MAELAKLAVIGNKQFYAMVYSCFVENCVLIVVNMKVGAEVGDPSILHDILSTLLHTFGALCQGSIRYLSGQRPFL